MKIIWIALSALIISLIGLPGLAQTCNDPPGADAAKIETSLRKLLDKRQVQFVGYTARVLASRPGQSCPDMQLFWALYNDAQTLLSESKMIVEGELSYTPPRPHYPRDLVLANKEGQCDVRFDLPKPGFAKNIQITCPANAFYHPTREAFEKVIFGPANMDAEFQPRENVVIPVSFELWWRHKDKKHESDSDEAETETETKASEE